MRKSFIFLISSLIILIVFAGCGGCNQSLGWGAMRFNKAHITIGEKDVCVEVESWHDNEIGCELKLKNGTSIYCAEGNYILVYGNCPICEKYEK